MGHCHAGACWMLAAALWLANSALPAFGQSLWPTADLSASVGVDEVDSATRAELQRITAFIKEGQWDEAIERLRAIIEARPRQVVRQGESHCLPLQIYCHLQIVRLPVEGLQAYRGQVDAVAGEWFRQAVATRDEQLLRRITGEFFGSSYGDDALDALGEIALEQGQFDHARRCWEAIHPSLKAAEGTPLWLEIRAADEADQWDQLLAAVEKASVSDRWLAYPDTDLHLATIRARLALTSVLEGTLDRAELELELIRRLHPEAQGRLAGRHQPLVPVLSAYLSAARSWPEQEGPSLWTTFAGSAARTGRTASDIDIAGPAWDAPIELPHAYEANQWKRQQFNLPQTRIGEPTQAPLSIHPLVHEKLLLVSNDTQIAAYDARTGKPAFLESRPVIYPDPNEAFHSTAGPVDALGVPRFTMTVQGDLLFARLGPPVTVHRNDGLAALSSSSSLVWLDLSAQGRLLQKVLPDDDRWTFDGAPLADDSRVYAVMRYRDVRPQLHVACFEIQTGRMLWRQLICSAETLGRGLTDQITHTLLTLHEGQLFVNSNQGVIAAISTHDGAPYWLHLYDRAKPGDTAYHFYREPNPCVYYQGLVLTAPSDSRKVLALDAATGAVVWEQSGGDIVQLLGVGGGHLIATGSRVYWFNVYNGTLRTMWPDGSGMKSYGRGLLAADQIFWPTQESGGFRIRVLHQDPPDPSQPQARQPIYLEQHGIPGVTAGNLLLADNRLFISGSNRVFAFSSAGAERQVAAEQSRPAAEVK